MKLLTEGKRGNDDSLSIIVFTGIYNLTHCSLCYEESLHTLTTHATSLSI